jgi:S-adenosylmethionine decarboxylase
MIVGTEWLIEAVGCRPEPLRDEAAMRSILSDVISDLELQTIGEVWHKFAGEGGITFLTALTESHITCHTYPEFGVATFNLYCCRERPEWDWDGRLKEALGARAVSIMRIDRGDAAGALAAGGESK